MNNRKARRFEGHSFIQNNLHMFVNRFTEDFSVPYHEHDFIEYCYVAEGNGFHHIGQETFPIHKGWLFVIPIGVAHVFRPSTSDPSGKPPVVYNCLFDAELADRLAPFQEEPIGAHLAGLGNQTNAYFSVFDRDGSIEDIMMKLHREMSATETGSKTMMHALLNQLIVTVYRLKYVSDQNQAGESADFTRIVHYLEQNVHEPVTLSELSRFAGWSARHLQRIFHKHTGQSFGSFVQHLRIRKSCEMLRGSTLKIGVIADLAGYRSIDTFNSAFKRTVGLTPTEYRKSAKGST